MFKSRKPVKKIEETEEKNENELIDNEWGIKVLDNAEESNCKPKVVESNTVAFSLDELKNQLGSLHKK